MRESCVRTRHPNRRVLTGLAIVASFAVASPLVHLLVDGSQPAFRSLLVQLSAAAGALQGATLVAALLHLAVPGRMQTLRRLALLVGLTSPAAVLMHLLAAACLLGLGAAGAGRYALVGLLLGTLGAAYLYTALGPGLATAYERGEMRGALARWLWRMQPVPAHDSLRVRFWAGAYTIGYAAATPWLAHTAFGAIRSAHSAPLLGSFVALMDVALGLAAMLTVAGVVLSNDAYELLKPREVGTAGACLGVILGVLGGVLLWQFAGVVTGAATAVHGLLPADVTTNGWRALVMFALAVGYMAPLVVLMAPSTRRNPGTLSIAGGTTLLGGWAGRIGLGASPEHTVMHPAELGLGIGLAALLAYAVTWLLHDVGLEPAEPLSERTSASALMR